MFYSQFILAKKGPLGTIWIAAHLERKLRKNQVTETNISVSVDSILFPEVPIALRLSGHLLLGVVRIYSRKVNYLFHDCSEALVKIKQAFHAGAVDLPPEAATAPFHSITLPETFDLDEFEPLLDKELNLLHSNGAVDHHISSREQITLQDPLEDNSYLGSSQFELDERFPDADAPRLGMDFDEDLLDKPTRDPSPVNVTLEEEEEEEMTLEEDVIPPTTMDDALDYDQLDRMDAMDMDDHEEPGTPALGIDNMDLDYQQEVDELENEHLHRSPDVLERLEPDFRLDNDEPDFRLDNDELGVKREAHLEPVTPGSPEPHTDADEEALDQQGEKENVDQQEEEENVGMQEVDAEVDKQVEDETSDRGGEEGISETNLEEETMAEKEMPGVDENQVVNEGGFGDRDVEEQEEVPDYETVMSAPAATSQEQDVFDLENDMHLEQASAIDYHERDQIIEERDPVLEEETIPVIQEEEPQPGMAEQMSPMRSPPLPPISSDDLPGDDDVLASLLGRGTPGLRVLPTPVETVVAKPRKRQAQRKRKIVMDMATILEADLQELFHNLEHLKPDLTDMGYGSSVMRQQLLNTDDIRRVRRKAPCTRQELWAVQKDALSQQLFCEHSVPGLCGELRVLFQRVYVVGEAKLPLAAGFTNDVGASEEVPEYQPAPLVENLNLDVNEMAGSPAKATVVEDVQGVPPTTDDHQHVDDAGTVDIFFEGYTHIQPEVTPVEDLQNVQSPIPGVDLEEHAPSSLPKDDAVDVSEAEVNPVDLNSESIEMVEAMGTLEVDNHPLIDVNEEKLQEEQEILQEEQEIVQVEQENNILDSVDAHEHVDSAAEPDGIIAPVAASETEGIIIPEVDNGTQLVGQNEIEAEFEVGVESGVVLPAETEVAADGHAETVPLEAYQEAEFQELEGKEEEPEAVDADMEVVIESASPPAAVEALPAGEQPNDEKIGFVVDTRDTEFLGADDDDLDEEAEDFHDGNEYGRKEPLVQDNSGWSARTRRVGHYLKVAIEERDTYMKQRKEQGTAKLALERMLVGKSRKEAARMFFETLVLKTKDYIHVEQDHPYADIRISARPKLLKANFS